MFNEFKLEVITHRIMGPYFKKSWFVVLNHNLRSGWVCGQYNTIQKEKKYSKNLTKIINTISEP